MESSTDRPPEPTPALLRILLENTSDIIHMLDAEGRIRYISPSVERVLGYAPQEMVGRLGHEFVHPEDLPYAEQTFDHDIRHTDSTRRLELRLRHRDGSWRSFEVFGKITQDESGAPIGIVTSHEVSERKRVEEALRTSNETLHGLIAAAPVPIVALDRRRLVRTWNPAAERVFGWSAEEVLGRALPLVPEHLRTQGEAFQTRALNGDALAGVDILCQRRDGSTAEVRIFTAPVRNDAGAIEGRVAVLEDTTEMKRLERERAQVLQVVSHDLRSPLTSILISADALAATATEADAKVLRGIIHSAQQIESLVRDVADIDRSGGGGLVLERSWMSLDALARDALTVLQPLARQKSIYLDFAPADDVCLLADRSRLLQVLSNLISNALRFTPEGGRISLRVERTEGEVQISVSDTGCGIAEGDLPHVFDRYWQGRHRSPGTSGLGLAIARGIVQAHGGRIWAESQVGTGSKFSFTIPLAPA